MKTITKTYQIYSFEELSEKAQEKVLSDLCNCNVDDCDWYQFTFEDWKEKLAEAGFENVNLYFTGFASQGDGACFTSDDLNWEKLLKGSVYEFLIHDDVELSGSIRQHGNYYHRFTMQTDYFEMRDLRDEELDEANDPIYNVSMCDVEIFILEKARALALELYRDLERGYDYQTSREAILETIEANEWMFLENGEMCNG